MAARGAVMAGVTSAIMLTLAAASTYKAFADKGPEPPLLPDAPPSVDTSLAGNAGLKQRKKATNTYSRRDTLLTGPMGVSAPPPTTRRTLLGG